MPSTSTHIEVTDAKNSSNKILLNISHIKKITASTNGCIIKVSDPHRGDYTETVSETYAALKTALGL